ncbi:MAG TPA: tetratricopeptide repeat protein [Luteimonas sp.]|nr:tetratricopeptide repeat protein [Luteimonas sp.]
MFALMIAAALALSAPAPVAAADARPLAEIMALPPALQAQLHDDVLVGHPSKTQRLERLVHFVFDTHGLGITYQADATSSVEQVYATRKVNCLSFTLLFLALARESGLEAYPQEVGETLSWGEVDGTIYRSNHINAGVRIAGHRYTVDVAANSVITRRPPVRGSDQRMLAQYYNNLAMERFLQGQLVEAVQDMGMALQVDPGYAPHWSNAGVLYLHSGDADAAERSYAKALALDPLDASALFNMGELMHRNGDRRREAEFRQRLARVQQKDPLQQFLLARDFERAGDYPSAIERYLRAIQLLPDEHRFYAALARTYLQSGDTPRARKALTRARLFSDGATRDSYRAQLEGLPQP